MEKEENFTEKKETSENQETSKNENAKNAETKVSDQTEEKLSIGEWMGIRHRLSRSRSFTRWHHRDHHLWALGGRKEAIHR
mgnify:CR=1 FL=1